MYHVDYREFREIMFEDWHEAGEYEFLSIKRYTTKQKIFKSESLTELADLVKLNFTHDVVSEDRGANWIIIKFDMFHDEETHEYAILEIIDEENLVIDADKVHKAIGVF